MKHNKTITIAVLVLALLTPVAKGGNPELPVNLGSAGNFVILGKTGISTVPPSNITGDMGVSPITATAITGFALSMDPSTTFSTSAQVTGKIYAADYGLPTPGNMTTTILDMQAAYSDAAGRIIPDWIGLGAGYEWLFVDPYVHVGPDKIEYNLSGGECSLFIGCSF
jgi:hypothetical protein